MIQKPINDVCGRVLNLLVLRQVVSATVTTVLLVKPLLCELTFMTKIHCVGSLDVILLKIISASMCIHWYVCVESISVFFNFVLLCIIV